MILEELCRYLDSEVPLSFQESYDNSGLQIGLPGMEINAALLTIDVTEKVIDEAIDRNCDVVISHHPLIFKSLKKLTGQNYTGRIIYKALRNNIAVYSSHTSLDATTGGVSWKMAEKLGLKNTEVLSPLKDRLLKLVTYIPEAYLDKVRDAVFAAGAGVTGKYDRCGFTTQGTGSFRGSDESNPFVGEKGQLHFEKEIRFETVMYSHLKDSVVDSLLKVHPYEEVAYDVYPLANNISGAGSGCTGYLENEMTEMQFLHYLSEVFDAKGIRYSKNTGKAIRKVSLCGGAGISFLNEAISCKSDAFVTGDIKYHNYFDADDRILLVDIGHFESEKFSTEILYRLIIKKFPKFAVRFSETNTNPINYL
jgi:dinuclear metal center YbgI/SA1388 family protein